jgi:hypothetical protein
MFELPNEINSRFWFWQTTGYVRFQTEANMAVNITQFNIEFADHTSSAVRGMNCLCLLKHWGCSLESH